MMNLIKIALVFVSLILATPQVFAEPKDGEDLEALDVLKTCISAEQKQVGKFVLTHFSNFHWWDANAVYSALHPDFVEWHSSRVLNAVLTPPEKQGSLPFKTGMYTKNIYLDYLSMLAYTSDAPTYVININRVECVSSNSAVLTSTFDARAVIRDEKGYIKKEAFIKNLEVKFYVEVKDNKIVKNITSLDDSSALALKKKLGSDFETAPLLAPVESTRITLTELYEKFYSAAGVANPHN